MSAATPPFVHRENADGTIDSICKECIVVVASCHWEAELERAEGEHKCDPARLEYLRELALNTRYRNEGRERSS